MAAVSSLSGLTARELRPAQEICAIRSLVRYRDKLIEAAAQQVLLLHSALDQMNVQIHHVLNDLTGTTGLFILEAILRGERNPQELAKLRDRRIKASEQTVAKSLVGDWRPEHLLTLQISFDSWKHFRRQIEQLDEQIAHWTMQLEGKIELSKIPALKRPKSASTNQPSIDLRSEFHRILGVDLTQIPAISALTVLAFLTEIGPDLGKFSSAQHFCSWLGLCPGTRISGGRVLDARTRRGKPRFAILLRQAALSLHSSRSILGARYRRLRSRLGAPKALTAMAHLLARIIYAMIITGKAYDETLFARLEEEHQKRNLQKLHRTAQALGYELRPAMT